MALAIALFSQAGCRSVTDTCNSLLHRATQTETETVEYPGPQRFWNKAGLVISPARTVAEVGTEVPMFAGICDDKGQLQPYEKVEWMLDNCSTGSLVSVNEPLRPIVLDLVGRKTGKIDNNHAVSETLPANVILTRGTPQIDDDIVMPRGYTWVTVTSPVEGDSYITAFAPDVYSWESRQRSATIHWIDAEWCFPEAGCVPPGAHAALVTCIQRRTTKSPVTDWIVKYTITGGAEAGFGPENAQSKEIATDADGKATAELIPVNSATGTTCVTVELIRPGCDDEPERLSIASAATHVNWTNTNVTLRVVGPNDAVVGSTANYRIEVTNPGGLPANDVAVTIAPPQGTAFVKSEPAPDGTAGPLTWRLGQIRGGEAKVVSLDLRIDQPGPVKLCALLTTADGLTAESCGTTNVVTISPAPPIGAPPVLPPAANPASPVPNRNPAPNLQPPPTATAPPAQPAAAPRLEINFTGPQTAKLAEDIVFNVQITNRGNALATGLGISDRFDAGLQHSNLKSPDGIDHSPIVRSLTDIKPGETQNVSLNFRVIKPGNLCHTVEVTGPGGLRESKEACVMVAAEQQPAEQPALSVNMTTPQQSYRVGDRVLFTIEVANVGTVTAAREVKMVASFEQGLQVDRGDRDVPVQRTAEGGVVYNIDSIAPEEKAVRHIECICVAPSQRSCGSVIVTEQTRLNYKEERCLQIFPAAAPAGRQSNLRLQIKPLTNPVRAGGEAMFRVTVTNTGTNSERQVRIATTAADSLTYIGSIGSVREANNDGQNIQFQPIMELRPGESIPLDLRFKAKRGGPAQVTAEATSSTLDQPLTDAATVNIFAE